jgi:hypothetical protein
MPNRGLGEGKGNDRAVIGRVGHIERFSNKDGGGVIGRVEHIEKFSNKDGGSKTESFDVVKRMAQIKKKVKEKEG